MDFTSLMISFTFGVIGMGMFMYGKKASRVVPLAAGAGLMVVPYLFTHMVVLLIVGCALTATPWLLRDM